MTLDKTFEAIAKLQDIEIELRRLKTALVMANKAIDAAVLAEREACAKIAEDYCGAWDDEGYALSNAIRARGQL